MFCNIYHKFSVLYIGILITILLLASCSEKSDTDEVATEVIDFNHLNERAFAELQSDTSYLLLHASNPDLLIGAISKVIVSKDRLYFVDGRHRYAVAYDSLGRSIGPVGAIGKGHLEYIRCHDMATDNQGNVYLSDGTGDKYIKYDSALHAIAEHKADPEGTEIFITVDGNMLVGLSPWNVGAHEGRSVWLYDSQMNLTETYGNIGILVENVGFGGTGFANSGQYISYVSPYEIRDDVMLFSPTDGKLVKKLRFDFGNKSVPDEYKTDIEKNEKQIEKYTRLQDIFSVTDDRVAGRISIDGKIRPFVINRAEDILYIGDEIDKKEESIAFIDNNFVNLRQIAREHYPDSVKKHIENNQTVLEFIKI